jgi:O-antigen/teichoic acid export membrane protein
MKSIILSTFSAWLARILAITLNLVGIPLALEKLGPSRFGLLLVILSIGSWIGFAHIGMGRVIASIVARRRNLSSKFASGTISLATMLAAVFNALLFITATGLFFLFVWLVPLPAVIAENYHEFVVSIVSLFFALSLWFFLSVFEGIDAGLHQLYRLYLFQLFSYLISLLVLLFYFPAHPSISFAAYLLNLGFLLGVILHAADVVRRNAKLFTLNFEWRRQTVRHIILTSLNFSVISLGIGILFQLATGLFGFLAGPETVVELGIFLRLTQSYGALVVAFTYPLSNIVASRLKAREYESAVHTVRLSALLLLVGSSVGAGAFLLLGQVALSFWLKTPLHLDAVFLAGASLLILLSACHFFLAALLIGTADIRKASTIQIVEAALFVPVAFVMFYTLQQGGVLLAMDIVLGLGALLMISRLRRHPVLGVLLGAPAHRAGSAAQRAGRLGESGQSAYDHRGAGNGGVDAHTREGNRE